MQWTFLEIVHSSTYSSLVQPYLELKIEYSIRKPWEASIVVFVSSGTASTGSFMQNPHRSKRIHIEEAKYVFLP